MKVILYGVGNRYFDLFCKPELESIGFGNNEIEVIGFSDGNKNVYGKKVTYNGKEYIIKNINEFNDVHIDRILVTTKVYFEEIRNELILKGFKSVQMVDDYLEWNFETINYLNEGIINELWDHLHKMKNEVTLFFELRRIKKIAIFGVSELQKRLIQALENTDIEICYLIIPKEDCGTDVFNIKVYTLDDELPDVDLIVVTSLNNYMDIEKKICEKTHLEVISIQEIVYRILKYCEKGYIYA